MLGYKAKCGKEQWMPQVGVDITEDDFEDGTGWCLGCGTTQEMCEPDAVRYVCNDCGEAKVYGLEELALRGLIATFGTAH